MDSHWITPSCILWPCRNLVNLVREGSHPGRWKRFVVVEALSVHKVICFRSWWSLRIHEIRPHCNFFVLVCNDCVTALSQSYFHRVWILVTSVTQSLVSFKDHFEFSQVKLSLRVALLAQCRVICILEIAVSQSTHLRRLLWDRFETLARLVSDLIELRDAWLLSRATSFQWKGFDNSEAVGWGAWSHRKRWFALIVVCCRCKRGGKVVWRLTEAGQLARACWTSAHWTAAVWSCLPVRLLMR